MKNNKLIENILNDTKRYKEFRKPVQAMANKICKEINQIAPTIQSEVRYKQQFFLEELIKELESRV